MSESILTKRNKMECILIVGWKEVLERMILYSSEVLEYSSDKQSNLGVM